MVAAKGHSAPRNQPTMKDHTMETTDNYWPYSYPKEWFDLVSTMNIHQRIHGAMADAKPVEKTSKDGVKFKFHGHEGVSAMVKALAEKWRFVIEAQVTNSEIQMLEIYGKMRPLTILTVSVSFINIDNPVDRMDSMAVGYGVDESDKGPGKALSYAIKMAELKTFSIHDGEKLDNEAFCYEHEREEKQLKKEKEAYDAAKKQWGALVKALKLDVKEEAARLKREYGDPPTLEGIQLDCDEMQIEIDKAKNKAKPDGVSPVVATEAAEAADAGPQFGDD